jgi:pimeloyl-ACP methyl ester carboxylesterase
MLAADPGAIMTTAQLHRATSADGTEIVGRVRGQGPPLVLTHAGLGDADLDCGALASLLEDHVTCFLASTRNRGLSGHSDDLSGERHIEDLVAFVESIGEPVGIATWSGGAIAVLGAAARTDAISAVGVYEPLVFELLDEQDGARLEAAVEHMAGLAEQAKLTEATRDWMTDWANEQEMAALAGSGYFEAAGPNVPVLLGQLGQLAEADEPSPTDPAELARITAPVLVLQGSQTSRRLFVDSVRHVAEHVPDARVREVPGGGHCGMVVEPGPTADQLIRLLAAQHAGAAGP